MRRRCKPLRAVQTSFPLHLPSESPRAPKIGSQTALRGFPPNDEVQKVSDITFGLLSQQIPVKWIRDDSKTYYGKFLDQLEEYCYETSFDGASETAGHCDEMGWFASLVDIHRVNGQVFPGRT